MTRAWPEVQRTLRMMQRGPKLTTTASHVNISHHHYPICACQAHSGSVVLSLWHSVGHMAQRGLDRLLHYSLHITYGAVQLL